MIFNKNNTVCADINEDALKYVWHPFIATVFVNVMIIAYAYWRRYQLTSYDRIAMIVIAIGVYLGIKHNFRLYYERWIKIESADDCIGTKIFAMSTLQIGAIMTYLFLPFVIAGHTSEYPPLWMPLCYGAIMGYIVIPSILFVCIFVIEYGTFLKTAIQFVVM